MKNEITTFAELITFVPSASVLANQPNLPVRHLLTDSRGGIQNEASLFIAINGERHNGHDFISKLHKQGVRQFVVEELPNDLLPESNVLLVPDSVAALQQIVSHYRRKFTLPVVGITGSNGKTIVKEWLSQLLMTAERVVKNPKSYNSQIGVPLSVWGIDNSHTIGIFEAGISKAGEMKRLARVIQPTVGIFTSIGSAHDEGFENPKQKIQEKAQLFAGAQNIIYRKEHRLIDQILSKKYEEQKCISWGTESDLKCSYYVHWKRKNNKSEILVTRLDSPKSWSFWVPFRDEVSLENITHALILSIHLTYDPKKLQNALNQLRPISMRMEWKQGINQCYLVDDSYSNDLVSLPLAIDFLKQQSQNDKFTIILSDILQSGESQSALYQKLAEVLHLKKIDRLIGIGPAIGQQRSQFESLEIDANFFPSTDAFLQDFLPNLYFRENILIKGARTFHFERIVRRLQQKIHSTVLEINLDALTHNLNQYRSRLVPTTKIMVMVKAFSYGGSAFEIANLLQFHRVDYLGVAYADEGIRLREHGIRTPIVVLNPAPEALETMLSYQLEPEIYSVHLLEQFVTYLGTSAQKLPIHLMLDTGMHRLGFTPEEIPQLVDLLNKYQLRVGSLLSHLAAVDEEEQDSFTQQQIQLFQQGAEQITAVLGYQPVRHILNSAGIIRFPEYQFGMVRLGIGLYGVDPVGQEGLQLQTVGVLKTVISQIKYLAPGDTVGYGRRGVVDKKSVVATVAIGYADGLDRGFGYGNMRMLVNGEWAPTLGSVCMDMTMIDITEIEARVGDEVIIFGPEQSVGLLAQKIDTIPYEILTNIGERVKRVFYRES